MSEERDLRKTLSLPAPLAALSVLGCELVLGRLRARIVEVEAYRGAGDPGSHAFRGPNPRNRSMFAAPGTAYLYFTYGNHWMLNVSTEPESVGAALLIRAAIPLDGQAEMFVRRPKAKRARDLLSGPGKLAAAFGLGRRFDGLDMLDPSSALRLESGKRVRNILVGPRVGLSHGRGERFLWRFADADERQWVSRPLSGLSPICGRAPLGDLGPPGDDADEWFPQPWVEVPTENESQ